MPTLRRGARDTRIAAKPGRPAILLESGSPYASRRVVVEYDGTATAAYLHDKTTAIAATWIANHGQAPAVTDMTRLNTGKAPVMPAEHTKHPGGRPVPEPQALRALWLEEGDGVAILENRRAARRDSRLVGHLHGHARLLPRHHRPDPVRLVAR